MKLRFLLVAALASVMAFAADVDGKWVGEGGGKGGPQTLTLKSAGDKLTGNLDGGRGGPVEISDGMIHGSDVMFKVVREFNGNKVTQSYNGKMTGGEMKLTVEVEGGGGKGKGPGEVTFKKQ